MTKTCFSGPLIFILSLIFSLSLFTQASLQERIYLSVSEQVTWSKAHNYCMEQYTDLATFRTKNELDAVHAVLSLTTVYWIGLQKAQNENIWIWSDGQEVTFTQWGHDELHNNGAEDCAVIRGGSWYGVSCGAKFAFLCYEDGPILVQENKTWEEALDYCRALDSDPDSWNIYFNYDLLHLDYKGFNSSARSVVLKAKTQEVWIGLRYLAGDWLWVNGNPLKDRLPACPAAGKYCGTMSKSGEVQLSNCSEKRNFICAKN